MRMVAVKSRGDGRKFVLIVYLKNALVCNVNESKYMFLGRLTLFVVMRNGVKIFG